MHLNRAGHECTVLAAKGGRHGAPVDLGETTLAVLRKSGFGGRFWAGYSSGIKRALPGLVRTHDIVQIHELWNYPGYVAARACRRAGVPYVVSVHGELDPWALAQKRLKKRVYHSLVQGPMLRSATAIHALSKLEFEQIRNCGLRNPVAVVPNGVDLDDVEPAGASGDAFFSECSIPRGSRIILFLGRLHYKKGLDILLQAFAHVVTDLGQAVLVVAGPDGGERKRLEAQAKQSGLADRVRFTGSLEGARKRAAYRVASAFVLPSRSEGFSMAALEALAMGVPVVLSRQCNFPEVAAFGAGAVVDSSPAAVADGIRQILSLSDAERNRIGANGRALVAKRFAWRRVAAEMASVYRWAIGDDASVPECLSLPAIRCRVHRPMG